MTNTPAESDAFFQLLTEALRAGPGSAQWGEAVEKLRDGGIDGADEYRLIIRAREDLESGRDFRRVSAGPGFTRKLLDAVEKEGARRKGFPTATIIALLCAGVIVAVVLTLLVLTSGGGGTNAQQAALIKLEAVSYPVALTSARFDSDTSTLPDGWRRVGELALSTRNGLKPETSSTAPTTQGAPKFVGGGIITSRPLSADSAAMVEAEIAMPATATGQSLTQLFVSDAPDFTPGIASAAHEIVWMYREGRVSIDVNGKGQESVALGSAGATMKIRIRFDGETAVVEAGNRRLYAGPHGLETGKPRYVGVRFIQAAGDTGEVATVRSINVSQAVPNASAGDR